jgi:primosomal protein N' (replication factor Y)
MITNKQKEKLSSVFSIFKKSSYRKFLLKYSYFSEQILFITKVIKESSNKSQNLIICSQFSVCESVLKILKIYFSSDEIIFLNKSTNNASNIDVWNEIKTGKYKIIIGTKSSIFAPFLNLENIFIIDEEHQDHKQYNMNPRYHISIIAEFVFNLYKNCTLIYTSSCPSIELYHKNLPILDISCFSNNIDTKIIKIDDNLEFFAKNYSVLSSFLINKIEDLVKNKISKIIIINNSKGFSNTAFCKKCGCIKKCEKCNIPYKYNKKENKLFCPVCGDSIIFNHICDKCGSFDFKFSGLGNEKIKNEILQLHKDLMLKLIEKNEKIDIKKVLNINIISSSEIDNTTKKLNDYDVIIGTEFFVKNYLNRISNIDSIFLFSVDNYLKIPDFRGNQELFKYITFFKNFSIENNVNNLFIKTNYSENEIIDFAVNSEYDAFYKYEIEIRKDFNYPPFFRFIKFILKQKSLASLEDTYKKILEIINKSKLKIIGEIDIKNKNNYQKNIIISVKDINHEVLSEISKYCFIDVDTLFLLK